MLIFYSNIICIPWSIIVPSFLPVTYVMRWGAMGGMHGKFWEEKTNR
jgi:hypothetical protein